jgi:hypothetical protein
MHPVDSRKVNVNKEMKDVLMIALSQRIACSATSWPEAPGVFTKNGCRRRFFADPARHPGRLLPGVRSSEGRLTFETPVGKGVVSCPLHDDLRLKAKSLDFFRHLACDRGTRMEAFGRAGGGSLAMTRITTSHFGQRSASNPKVRFMSTAHST